MRRILHATIFISAVMPSAVLAQWNRPIPQDPARQEKRRKEMLEWNRKTLVEAYDQVGRKNPRWDGLAHECLEAAARVFSHVVEPFTTYLDVHNGAKAAIEGGCDDPLILYLYARSSIGPYNPGPAELIRRYVVAAAALDRSGYPRIRRFTALYKAGQCETGVAGGAAEAERLSMASLRVVTESAERDERSRDLEDAWFTAVKNVHYTLTKLKKNSFAAFQQIDRELAKTPALEVLRLQYKADFYINYAWEARGSGFADTVTPEGWEKFDARLRVARKALGEAWLAKPGDWHTANKMLIIAKGLNFSRAEMEKWFERAMTADGDNLRACEYKLDWLDPKWHGTQEELLAFGRACRDTGNWRGGITVLIGHAHLIVYSRLPSGSARQKYMSSPEVQNDIVSVYRQYLSKYSFDSVERSRFAVLLYYCGRYEESHLQFLQLGADLNWSWGIKENRIKEIRDIVAKEAILKPPQNPKAATTTVQKPAPAKSETAKPRPKSEPAIPEFEKALGRSAEFPAEKFRYTLPGPEWSWAVRPVAGALCAARNRIGFALSIGAVKLPNPMSMDEKAAEGLEKGFFDTAGGQVRKRGGRFVNFRGIRCYQLEVVATDDGQTSVVRFLSANGLLYSIVVFGDEHPVEASPEFEKIVNGFEFTEPPVLASGDEAKKSNDSLAFRLGEALGTLMIVTIAIAFIVKLARKNGRAEADHLSAPLRSPGHGRPRLTEQWEAEDSARQAARQNYRKGMTNLGRGLIALAVLMLAAAGLSIFAAKFDLIAAIIMAVVLGGFAAIYLVLGVLTLCKFNWVNYLVAVWSSFLLVLNFISLGSNRAPPGGSIGVVVGLLIVGSLLYFSIKNIGLHSKLKDAS